MTMHGQPEASWETKAAFMRRHNAVEACWDHVGDLVTLKLGPPPAPPRPPGPAAQMAQRFAHATGQQMPDARARQRHETMFAASSLKPPFPGTVPTPDSDVPRAVRAKRADVTGGPKKRTKR